MSQVPLDWKRLGALVLFGAIAGAIAALLCVRMATQAVSTCHAGGPGDGVFNLLVLWPALSLVNAGALIAPPLMLRGSHLAWLGLLIGFAIVAIVAFLYLSGVPASIASHGGLGFCSSGMPENWPAWLIR